MLRRCAVGVLTACAVLVAASTATSAAVLHFNFPITVDQEVPTPTINPGQLVPAGVGFTTFDTDTNLFTWEIHYAGLTGQVTGAHVHGPAPFGVTAGVLWHVTPTYPLPPSGTMTGSRVLNAQEEQWLLDGLLYVNIHTPQNPPGEIRGQIIPEPALLGSGLVAGLLLLRRRGR